MSFCGFVSFSTSDHAAEAERAMRAWVSQSAASRDDHEWRATSSRGWMCAFSLVADPAHSASLQQDPGVSLVGDVPFNWLADPDGAARRATLARVPPREVSDAIPSTEFALAAWSEEASSLTLCRCPFGARALLYVCEPRSWIAFASLPEPLLTIPGVKARIDEPALAARLVGEDYWLQPADSTLFARLRRLPAGHALRFAASAFSLDAYWKADSGPPANFGPDDPEVPVALLRLLNSAVHRRIAGFKSVGVQLSGGLDSSAVTALAHAQCDFDARLHAYTIKSHDERGQVIHEEERRLAGTLVAGLAGVTPRILPHHKTHRPYYLFHREYLERPLPEMVFLLGAEHRILDAARHDRCEVVLTGWGGDEMVSARTRLHVLTMMAEGRWRLAARNVLPYDGSQGMLRTLVREVAAPLRSALIPHRRWPAQADARIQMVFAGKPLARWVSEARWRRGSMSLREERWSTLCAPGFSAMLELHDWLGQRAGIAVSHPLLDRDLVAFCHRMPVEWVAHLGIRRRAFRAAMANVLPPDHLAREKSRRPRPVDRPAWRRRYQSHAQRALQDLADSETWLHGYVNLPALAAARREGAGLFDRIDQTAAAVLVVARLQPGPFS